MTRKTRETVTLWGLFAVAVVAIFAALLASNGTMDWLL